MRSRPNVGTEWRKTRVSFRILANGTRVAFCACRMHRYMAAGWVLGFHALLGCSGASATFDLYAPSDAGEAADVQSRDGGTDASASCRRHTTAEACGADNACTFVAGCSDCRGGFNGGGCYGKDEPRPAFACAPCLQCQAFTDEASCRASGSCHAVFRDPGTCDCTAAGCCLSFFACAPGATARCNATTTMCKQATPMCKAGFTVGYTDTCFEGCVRETDCK